MALSDAKVLMTTDMGRGKSLVATTFKADSDYPANGYAAADLEAVLGKSITGAMPDPSPPYMVQVVGDRIMVRDASKRGCPAVAEHTDLSAVTLKVRFICQ